MKQSLLLLLLLTGFLQEASSGKDHDDDDDDDSHEDDYDDDGQPHYCPKKNGMFPNPTDCTSYYQCADGTPNLMACAPGLLFDPKKKMCNFPGRVKCSSPCRGRDGLFPSQHRCDEFVLCNNNKPKKYRCKKGLYFDANLQVCNYKDAVLCTIPGNRKYHDDDDYDSHSKKEYTPTRQCPKAYGIFPHSYNCSTFYMCSGGVHKVQECPGDLHYDRRKRRCNFPHLAGCAKKKKNGSPLKNSLSPETSFEKKPKKNRLCPKYHGVFKNAWNCSTFFSCIGGTPILQECPPGLVFDQETIRCDFPHVVGCDPPPGVVNVLVCPEHNGVFRSPSNCSVFYLCKKGRPYKYECPLQLSFDIEKKRCEYPENVNCPESRKEKRLNAKNYMQIRQINREEVISHKLFNSSSENNLQAMMILDELTLNYTEIQT